MYSNKFLRKPQKLIVCFESEISGVLFYRHIHEKIFNLLGSRCSVDIVISGVYSIQKIC